MPRYHWPGYSYSTDAPWVTELFIFPSSRPSAPQGVRRAACSLATVRPKKGAMLGFYPWLWGTSLIFGGDETGPRWIPIIKKPLCECFAELITSRRSSRINQHHGANVPPLVGLQLSAFKSIWSLLACAKTYRGNQLCCTSLSERTAW